MKLRFFLLSLLVLRLLTSCDNEWSKEDYELWLDKNSAEILAITKNVDCIDAEEWSIIEVGHGICGGPANYIPVHKSTNTVSFQRRIAEYNRISKTYRDKWYSDVICCLIYWPSPTGVNCVDGQAELVYNNGCDDIALIWPEGYANANDEGLIISNITADGVCVRVEYAASGCDGNTWQLQLIDSGDVAESDPVQRYLKFNFINTEVCDAHFQKETSFNISTLLEDNTSAILHIDGWDEAIIIQ